MAQLERLRGRGEVEVVIACDLDAARRSLVQERFRIPRVHHRSPARSSAPTTSTSSSSSPRSPPTGRSPRRPCGPASTSSSRSRWRPTSTTGRELAGARPRARTGLLVCAPHIVLSPTYQAIWRLVRRGRRSAAHRAARPLRLGRPDLGRVVLLGLAAGALFDISMYNITGLTGLLGPVRRVAAMTGIAIAERTRGGAARPSRPRTTPSCSSTTATARSPRSRPASPCSSTRSPAIEVYGAEGTVQILGDDWAPQGYDLWTQPSGPGATTRTSIPAGSGPTGSATSSSASATGRGRLIRPEHAFHALEVVLARARGERDRDRAGGHQHLRGPRLRRRRDGRAGPSPPQPAAVTAERGVPMNAPARPRPRDRPAALDPPRPGGERSPGGPRGDPGCRLPHRGAGRVRRPRAGGDGPGAAVGRPGRALRARPVPGPVRRPRRRDRLSSHVSAVPASWSRRSRRTSWLTGRRSSAWPRHSSRSRGAPPTPTSRSAIHNEESQLARLEGTTPWSILVEATDPALVALQLDLFAMLAVGIDPLPLIARHARQDHLAARLRPARRTVRPGGPRRDRLAADPRRRRGHPRAAPLRRRRGRHATPWPRPAPRTTASGA